MQKPWRSRKVTVEKNNGRYDEWDPTGCEIIWRSGVEKRSKAEDERKTEHEEEERQENEEEQKESEECLLQHSWRGNFSPQFP
jgi:hypothetical protein